MEKQMLIIHSAWNQKRTFKLISISKDCPYNEAIYDPDQKILAVISKEKKESFQLVPKFTDKGDVLYLKGNRENGKNYAEERRAIESWYEYYLDNVEDIKHFIDLFAENASTFEFEKFISSPVEPPVVS
jgi:hypothetical protein